ncbi:MAG TPA: hypothetical protein VMG38_17615 [Trebonia sp.]|nr:hypothetical protein [Trebonia sp.]
MAASTSGASGTVRGRKRAATVPSGRMRNFSKFHWMSPAWPESSDAAVSDSWMGCRPGPFSQRLH